MNARCDRAETSEILRLTSDQHPVLRHNRFAGRMLWNIRSDNKPRDQT
jgi:hypothetical protein